MSSELCWLPAVELAGRIRRKEVSPVEVVDAVLAQIDRVNERTNAIVTRLDDIARRQAQAAEEAVMQGERLGPLHGVPFTIKDLHLTRGVRTTLGSRLFENFVPDRDAIVVERMVAAGAIPLGKTNASEFGLLPLTTSALWGDARNPWDSGRNTGGSSGGSAAAVACGMGPLATASDGGGSIRIPASFCGLFGIKPQMGRVPHDHFPRGWESLSHQGPVARTVRDAALMLDCIAGPHLLDRWSLPAPGESYLAACDAEPRGLRLAWSRDLGGLPVDDDVARVCEEAARSFESLGCHVEEVALNLPDLGPAQQVIVLCETATAMEARRDEWQRVIDPQIARLPAKAEKFTYRDLVRAHWEREEYWRKLAPLFETYDALLTPTASIVAPPLGTLGPTEVNGQRVRALYWLGFCVPFNMTWQPAATVPVGFNVEGLPVGLQLVARPHDEAALFRLAAAYEAAHPWAGHKPPVVE